MNNIIPRPIKERKKHDRFNGMPEEEVSKRTLPDHLTTNLDIIIVSNNTVFLLTFFSQLSTLNEAFLICLVDSASVIIQCFKICANKERG